MFARSVRAEPSERTRCLPGDDLIQTPIASITHAITIRRPPRDVWPWLVQMGAGRAGGTAMISSIIAAIGAPTASYRSSSKWSSPPSFRRSPA